MTEWEPVLTSEFSSTDRLPVPGGWLYRVQHHSQRLSAQSVVFVPVTMPTAYPGARMGTASELADLYAKTRQK